MTITIEPGQTGEIPAIDPAAETRNLAQYLTNSTGRHTAGLEARPKDYVGKHRVQPGQLSTMQRLDADRAVRAEASRAMSEAVA